MQPATAGAGAVMVPAPTPAAPAAIHAAAAVPAAAASSHDAARAATDAAAPTAASATRAELKELGHAGLADRIAGLWRITMSISVPVFVGGGGEAEVVTVQGEACTCVKSSLKSAALALEAAVMGRGGVSGSEGAAR
ncbi:hypothetical protein FOA52_011870 [Chlamydomonas sp. UWO 241]|nr:hypothetical protein FOA52_015085 [Chlamydomonas sp. UWO 241]KAG1661139.1 hypothetical protein FOA52_011870 [Chlamydomonas sp. UWO 241]